MKPGREVKKEGRKEELKRGKLEKKTEKGGQRRK